MKMDELGYVFQRVYENSSMNPTGQIYFMCFGCFHLQNASAWGGLCSQALYWGFASGPHCIGLSTPRLLVQSAPPPQDEVLRISRHACDLRLTVATILADAAATPRSPKWPKNVSSGTLNLAQLNQPCDDDDDDDNNNNNSNNIADNVYGAVIMT